MTQPVRLMLIKRDGSKAIVIADETAIKLQPKIVRSDDVIYEYKGDDQREGVWVKLYYETKVVDL